MSALSQRNLPNKKPRRPRNNDELINTNPGIFAGIAVGLSTTTTAKICCVCGKELSQSKIERGSNICWDCCEKPRPKHELSTKQSLTDKHLVPSPDSPHVLIWVSKTNKSQGAALPPAPPASATINPIAVNLTRLIAVKALPAPKAALPKEPEVKPVAAAWENLVDHVLNQAAVVSNLDYAVAASKEVREIIAQSTPLASTPKAPDTPQNNIVVLEDAIAWKQARKAATELVALYRGEYSWQTQSITPRKELAKAA